MRSNNEKRWECNVTNDEAIVLMHGTPAAAINYGKGRFDDDLIPSL